MDQKRKILLHEPNENSRAILFQELEAYSQHREIVISHDDSDFVKKLSAEAFDLVVMDHKAVDHKGDHILEQLKGRQFFPKIEKFIITSSHLYEAPKPTEMGEIPLTFVSKPFRPEVLSAALFSSLNGEAPPKDPKWKIDARLLNPFIEAVLESFDESAKISLIKKSVDLKKNADVYDLSVTSSFDQGELFGVISVGFLEKAYLHCAKKFLKTEERVIHQKNLFVAEELLKKSIEKIRSAATARNVKSSFRSPIVTIGKKHAAPSPSGIHPLVIKFEDEDGLPVHVEVSLQKNSLSN
jgi:DNA-binding NarL/FixJ family response regulator